MRCRLFFLIVFTFIVFTPKSEAKPFSDIEWGILQLEFFGMRLHAIENDMRLQVDRDDFRDGRKVGGRQSVTDIKKLRAALKQLKIDSELSPLQIKLDGLMARLQDVYLNIHKKTDKQIGKELGSFWQEVDVYNKEFFAFVDSHFEMPKLPDDFSLLIKEAKLIKNEKDRMLFVKASKYVDIKKTFEAWKILEGLLSKYKGTEIEGMLLTRAVQSFQVDKGPVLEHFRKWDRDLVRLKKFLDRQEYSTSLYDLYPQWQTLEQSYNHGMSNMSEIPNGFYIDTRLKLIETIRDHLAKNPDDNWARVQTFLIMNVPLIERDCGQLCQMGNSNLLGMARYYLN